MSNESLSLLPDITRADTKIVKWQVGEMRFCSCWHAVQWSELGAFGTWGVDKGPAIFSSEMLTRAMSYSLVLDEGPVAENTEIIRNRAANWIQRIGGLVEKVVVRKERRGRGG
jgi:hypothetical protein